MRSKAGIGESDNSELDRRECLAESRLIRPGNPDPRTVNRQMGDARGVFWETTRLPLRR
jgi:hypothetical protein